MLKKVLSLISLLVLCSSILFAQDESNKDKFFEDIRTGNIKSVKEMLKDDINPDVKDQSGTPALFIAAASYHIDIVKLLIKEGADVNIKDDGWRQGNAFGTLIPFYGINIEDMNDEKERKAAIKDSYNIIKLLIKKGLEVNVPEGSGYSPLMDAVEYKLPEICELLIKNGADVNYVGYGTTALLISVRRSLEIVKLLINNGADITFIDEDFGRNVLMHAISSSEEATDIVIYLIEQGVDPNLTNSDGDTALDLYYRTSITTNGKTVDLSLINMELGAYLKAYMEN